MSVLTPLPHPHGAPHAALIAVVRLDLQHVGAAGLSVQSPAASRHQPRLPVYAEQIVAVSCRTIARKQQGNETRRDTDRKKKAFVSKKTPKQSS